MRKPPVKIIKAAPSETNLKKQVDEGWNYSVGLGRRIFSLESERFWIWYAIAAAGVIAFVAYARSFRE